MKRTRVIAFRVDDNEYLGLSLAAFKEKVNIGEYVRRQIGIGQYTLAAIKHQKKLDAKAKRDAGKVNNDQ